jgi:arylsulfatase A-like enzyme
MSDELISLIDMMPSFAELTGVTLPSDAAPDAVNVLPALLGQPHLKSSRDVFVMHNGGIDGPFAIRQGAWKLIATGAVNSKQTQRNAPQLFNLVDDLGETKDLADKNPEKVKELTELLRQIRAK